MNPGRSSLLAPIAGLVLGACGSSGTEIVTCGPGTALVGHTCEVVLTATDGGPVVDSTVTVEAASDARADATVADSGSAEASDASVSESAAEVSVLDAGSVSVVTQHNDLARTGANLQESILTTSNVVATQFGKLYCLPVDDQIYGQPLVVSGLTVQGVTRNVLFVASVSDTVYAFDSEDPFGSTPLWQSSLLPAGEAVVTGADMTGACEGHYSNFTSNIGIVGTPVVDPVAGVLYAVARSVQVDGTFVQRLHALDIHSGMERPGSPVSITATVSGTGDGTTTIDFDEQHQNQRAGLLLVNGTVYITWASHCDWAPYHGWVIGYDATTLAQTIAWVDTPNASLGGIWMGGQAPSADPQGNIYLASGNGAGLASDPTDRGESMLKLSPASPTLDVESWFTPWDYSYANVNDVDLGSSGVLLVPGTSLAVTGDKGSKLYVVDKDNMGGLNPLPNDGQIVQSISLSAQGVYGSPVFWSSPNGPLLYVWPAAGPPSVYHFNTGTGLFDDPPLAQNLSVDPSPAPGAMLSLSANQSLPGTGILWASLSTAGTAVNGSVPGLLRAFDASDVSVELWDSNQEPERDGFGYVSKFAAPTVANGRVYVSTFSNQVCVFGLLGDVPLPAAPTSLAATSPSSSQVDLVWQDTSGGKASFVLQRASGGAAFSALQTLAPGTTRYTDSNVVAFETYQYRVASTWANATSGYSNTVTVMVNGGHAQPSLLVTGNGLPIAPGEATTPSDETDFLAAPAPSSPVLRTFVLSNRGTGALTLGSGAITLSGTNAGEFAITQAPVGTITPGGSGSLELAFAPPSFGDATATVTIASNDPVTPMYSFPIRGSGITQLVGWWRFDDGSGAKPVDSSGHDDTGAFLGNPVWTTQGEINGAIVLAGQSAITVSATDSLSPTMAMSISVWINPSAPFTGAANPRFVQKGATDDQYRLLVENSALKFEIAGLGTAETTTLPPASTWTHLAGTYDGSNISLWVDGVQVATSPATGVIPNSGDPLLIGTKTAGTEAGDYFQGTVDEVRIYSRALAAVEIQVLASGSTCACP